MIAKKNEPLLNGPPHRCVSTIATASACAIMNVESYFSSMNVFCTFSKIKRTSAVTLKRIDSGSCPVHIFSPKRFSNILIPRAYLFSSVTAI